MIARIRVGYLLQGLGAADIFAALYFDEMQHSPADPDWEGRDRLLLSAAHNTALLYATFAEAGAIPLDALETYTRDGSALEVNASERMGTLVEATCGSLGQGLSVAVGMALSLRRRQSASRVYVVLGDGELQEGQVWEAALCASGFGLDNLCLIVDRNYMQVDGHTDKVRVMDPIDEKFAAFGWKAVVLDGNNMGALVSAFDLARTTTGQPTVIVANTTPGAGVEFLAGQLAHVAYINADEAARALEVLEEVV
ncbi:transketolase [Bradyrhizobium vignae]|uniref:Transketolase n=2 Tax=Bradyrhizobium vignae TaxID=1549949 RepID=A0ABS4A274_9BRAD|nr:transketolase [Bradyrhizobium vignae]